MKEKSRNLKEEVVPTSYHASIVDEDLDTFIVAGWIEAKDLEDLTERQIQECVEKRCERKTNGEKLYLIEQSIKGVNMQMHIMRLRNECGRCIGSVVFSEEELDMR